MIPLACALLAAALSGAPSDAPNTVDQVRLFSSSSPEYLQLAIPESLRVAPEAVSRLVLFRGGMPVLDRGLALDVEVTGDAEGGTRPRVERGFVENAEVSLDGTFAIILATHYRKTLGVANDSETVGKSELTWIEPEHPKGLWSVTLENGVWVKRVLLLSARHGVALSTIAEPSGPADLRLFSPEGIEMLRVGREEGSVVDLQTTSHGVFLGVDLAYPDRPGLPNRGVQVFDLLHGTRWSYTWSYGEEREPMSWALGDTGILEIKTAEGLRAFDRNGKPLRASRRK